jgi:hypothetical protein
LLKTSTDLKARFNLLVLHRQLQNSYNQTGPAKTRNCVPPAFAEQGGFGKIFFFSSIEDSGESQQGDCIPWL